MNVLVIYILNVRTKYNQHLHCDGLQPASVFVVITITHRQKILTLNWSLPHEKAAAWWCWHNPRRLLDWGECNQKHYGAPCLPLLPRVVQPPATNHGWWKHRRGFKLTPTPKQRHKGQSHPHRRTLSNPAMFTSTSRTITTSAQRPPDLTCPHRYALCDNPTLYLPLSNTNHQCADTHRSNTSNQRDTLTNPTSYLPPEQARESGVSLVLSDWASMSAPWSNKISTTSRWPAVAPKIRGVKPAMQFLILISACVCSPAQKSLFSFTLYSFEPASEKEKLISITMSKQLFICI